MAMAHLTPAIGIDLGTTYSCVGVWQRDRVEIIPNDQGNHITPSCFSFSDNECFIGEAAKNDAMNPTNTVFDVKRLIGRKFSDPSVQNDIKLWPFTVVSGPCNKPKIVVKYKVEERQFSAEEISSMVLAKMKEVAEVYLGRSVKDAVITVPAYFNDSQRRSMIDAGTIAGLNVMHIMDEPTAAAVAYEFHKMDDYSGRKKNVLVFDLGGGTFQVSVLSMGRDIELKATAGDTHLGGKVFDDRMLKHFIDEFRRKYEKDIHGNLRAVQRLRTACERAKQVLSFLSETTVQVDCLHEGIDFSTHISKGKFEDLNKDLFNRCMDLVKNCLKDANIEKHGIDVVILVGGSTNIPKVQNLLQEYFHGTEIFRGINADEAVAYGAAVQGAKLSGHVTPLSLGFGTTGGKMITVIPRNIPIPTNKTYAFSVARHDQEEMNNQASWLLKVYEGERSEAKYNNLLDELSIFVLATSQNFSVIIVLVSFEIDADGILSVTARNKTTGEEEKFTITNRKQRLSSDEIERMMQDAERFRANDEEFKRKYEAWNTLDTCVHEMVNAFVNKNAARMHSVAIQRKIKEVILRAHRLENHRPLPNAIDSELMMNELKVFRPLLGLP